MTRFVNDAAASNTDFAKILIASVSRHVKGDWGDVCKEDWQTNEDALRNGFRLFSVYALGHLAKEIGEKKIWIITEADRSATTVLFPSEY